ncbi:MAG: leucine-rich repeat domain-containing protein [Eubacteriales bacterium]
MKKIISLFLIICVLCATAAVFASCGGDPTPSSASTSDTETTAGTTTESTTLPITRTFENKDIIDSLDYHFYARLLRDENDNITAVAVQEWKTDESTITIPSEYVYGGKKYPVTMVGFYATLVKNDATGVKEVVIPSSVKTISQKVFTNFVSLEKVTIAEGLETIEPHAFWKCTKLSDITLPSTLKSIGAYAFANCTSLTSIVIPASVTEIEPLAFSGCTGLKSVTLPASFQSQVDSIFKNCEGIVFNFS